MGLVPPIPEPARDYGITSEAKEAAMKSIREDTQEAIEAAKWVREEHRRKPTRVTSIGLKYCEKRLLECIARLREWEL